MSINIKETIVISITIICLMQLVVTLKTIFLKRRGGKMDEAVKLRKKIEKLEAGNRLLRNAMKAHIEGGYCFLDVCYAFDDSGTCKQCRNYNLCKALSEANQIKI